MVGDIYSAAAGVIDSAVNKQGSLKHLCYSSPYRNKKKLFALVFETVKHKKLLEKVVSETETIWGKLDEPVGTSLKLVLLYETLLGRGVHIQSQFHDILQDYRELLFDLFQKISQKFPSLLKTNKDQDVSLPRYVRVNTIKMSVDDAIEYFVNANFQLVEGKKVNELLPTEFMIDADISNLLVFHGNTDLHSNILYQQGEVLLQDKASCLPAYILDPPMESFIIDACAAPGNKSSHLASIIRNNGVVYSFDLNEERFKVMNKLINKAGASCVKTKLKDFLKVKHDSPLYSQVNYILLDPSCSGSGIVSRRDGLIDGDVEAAKQSSRLKALSGFQTAALSHALSFPLVKKVVYSTCSIYKEENEDVIEKAWKRFSPHFQLVTVMPEWKNRGVGEWQEARKCIRALPESDFTNGFFVAMFERIPKEENFKPQTRNLTEIILSDKSDHCLNHQCKTTKKRQKVHSTELLLTDVNEPFRFDSTKKRRKKGGMKKPVTKETF